MSTLKHYTELARRFAPKGQITKSAKEWYDLHQSRIASHFRGDPLPNRFGKFVERAQQKMVDRYTAEIRKRGFDTYIQEERREVALDVFDREGGLWLLGADGWRHYSRRFGQRYTQIRYLCGTDDNGDWAVRVPGTCECVNDALDYTIPKEVQKAKASGKRVVRQGDVFAIETKRDGKHDLPSGHTFDKESRFLIHDGGHQSMHVPFPCKFLTAYGLPPRSAYRRTGWFD